MDEAALAAAYATALGAAALVVRTRFAPGPSGAGWLTLAWAGAAAARAEFTAAARLLGLLALDAVVLAVLVAMLWKAGRGWAAPAIMLQAVAVMAAFAGWSDPRVTPELQLAVSHAAAVGAAALLAAGALAKPFKRRKVGRGARDRL